MRNLSFHYLQYHICLQGRNFYFHTTSSNSAHRKFSEREFLSSNMKFWSKCDTEIFFYFDKTPRPKLILKNVILKYQDYLCTACFQKNLVILIDYRFIQEFLIKLSVGCKAIILMKGILKSFKKEQLIIEEGP